ncbi:MAG: exodeoxyribonuclease VII small subunit [Eggerthellaceae bacterium]|nr:exodeoxyribonuclease VII small subunit [Eggerthellaceae bacterium]
MANNDHLQDFEAIKTRLEEIVEAVSDESIPLDDALDLYEEAVELGMRVSDVLEDGIEVDEAALAGEGAGEQTQDSESSDEPAASQAANE